MSKPFIFISYRRDDSAAGHAQHLCRDLSDRFGPDAIFMDIGSIRAGAEWRSEIGKALSSCEVLLAIIGRQWLTIAEPSSGRRRLDNPNDLVRFEISEALRRNITVIPVRMHGANLPKPDDLPDELRSLVNRQEHEITDRRWDYDVGELVNELERLVTRGGSTRTQEVPLAMNPGTVEHLTGKIDGLSFGAAKVIEYLVLHCEPGDYVEYESLRQALRFDEQQLGDALDELKDEQLIESLAAFGSRYNLLKPHVRAWEKAGYEILGFYVLEDMLAVAATVNQQSPIDGPQLLQITGFSVKRINLAVLLLESYGRLNLLKPFGTAPYLFAQVEANYRMRQWLKSYQRRS